MKKILTLCLLLLGLTGARADEGMWLLKLMEQQHLEDSLRKAGLAIPAEGLYSETAPSIRECVGIFGGGCTGEVVSADGLLLTNHHCGFSFVHAMSTIEHNYMKDGYFAKSRAEELPTPGLTFTFVRRIIDVTADVNAAARKAGVDEYTAQSADFLEPLAEKMLKKSDLKKEKGILARIVPFFGGNQFYLFYEQEYSDVRLVASPPNNVGQFGGNSDNWIWPRQNADFAMFRIYADEKGRPAPYSEKNVPLRVNKFLPISMRGINEGDYTMIMGFPGRTSRYLTASQVQLRCESQNAPMVIAGNPLLKYYKDLMDQSDSLRLKYEDTHFSYGNAVKNYGGMNESVEKTGLIAQKRAEEKAFRAFAAKSGKAEYRDIIDRIDSLCTAAKDTIHDMSLYNITVQTQEFLINTALVDAYVAAVAEGKEKKIEAAREAIMGFYTRNLAGIDLDIDHNRARLLIPIFLKHKRLAAQPAFLQGDWQKNVDDVFTRSAFTSREKLESLLQRADTAALKSDPLVTFTNQIYGYVISNLWGGITNYNHRAAELKKIYQRGLCEMYDWTKSPDANFTLRMTYGHIRDFHPRDAVHYDWRTVLDGMFEKESKTESDYFINERLRSLYEARDFGPYAREDGKLPTCFLSDNDITGGNSGSGVLNARGELIGLAFDGNIESLSSDLKYNGKLQRCINVDIRYVLFILDKFGGSKYVFDELDLRK